MVAASADTAHTAHTAVPCVSTAHVTKTLPSISSKTLPLQRLTGVGGGGYRWQAAVAFPVPVTVPPAGAGADPGVVTLLQVFCRCFDPFTKTLLQNTSRSSHLVTSSHSFHSVPLLSYSFRILLHSSTLFPLLHVPLAFNIGTHTADV